MSIFEEFQVLKFRWHSETAHVSSWSERIGHPAYQEIIALGHPVVPYLLADLRIEPTHWFTALKVITGQNPVPAHHRGELRKMTEDWLAWGEHHGLTANSRW